MFLLYIFVIAINIVCSILYFVHWSRVNLFYIYQTLIMSVSANSMSVTLIPSQYGLFRKVLVTFIVTMKVEGLYAIAIWDQDTETTMKC